MLSRGERGIKEEDMKDKIDYLVSDLWRDWYSSLGLTYPTPKRYERPKQTTFSDGIQEEIEELKQKIKRLEERQLRKNNLEWF